MGPRGRPPDIVQTASCFLLPASGFGPKSKAAGMMGSWCLCLRVDGKPRQRPDPEDGQKFTGMSSAEFKILAQRERRMEPKGRERVVGKAPAYAKATKGESGWGQTGRRQLPHGPELQGSGRPLSGARPPQPMLGATWSASWKQRQQQQQV